MLGKADGFRRRPYRVPPAAPALWRGLAALDEGDQEQSRALLNQVLEGKPSTLEEGMAHYYLGVLAAQDEAWEEAGRQWAAARASGLRSPWLEDNTAELFHRMAEERLRAQDLDGALEAALVAARHKPTDNRLSELIAQTYEQEAYEAASEGDWEVALEHWQQARDVGGGSFRVAYNLALAYEHNEDFIAAGEAWREALRRRPRREDHPDAVSDEQVARLWRRAAEAYHKAGEFEEAANVYRQALKWNPDDLDTRMTLAEGLLNDGRLQAAQNELDRILERDPNHIPALLLRGEVTAASERWWYGSAAPGYWERVLELEPQNASARQHLVDFYHEQAEDYASWGNYQGAIAVYEEALRYAPQNAHLLAALGGCYLRTGDQRKAVSYIERAQSADPTDLDAYQEIIHAWLDLGHVEQAWEAVDQAEAAVGDIPFLFYVTLAALCIEADENDLARPFLDRAVQEAPPGEPVLNMIGEMAMMSGAPDIAREYLQQAIRAGSRKGQAHLVLGVLSATGDDDLEEAERHWREADKIARRERDSGLRERIEMARMMFSAPRGLLDMLLRTPFFPGGLDLDDPGFFDEEEDDDEF
jgi:tetratricopeptide (TPR) repeat protein